MSVVESTLLDHPMRGLRTLTRLSSPHRSLVLRALVIVACTRLALSVLSFRTLQHLINVSVRLPFSLPAETQVTRLVWAVRAASKRVPAASCLTQSLALQFMMAQSGRAARIHIGVAKQSGSVFQAHAWVEYAGTVLLSELSEIESYSPLITMECGQA